MCIDELLIKARELVSFQRPTDRDYRSVRTWLHNLRPIVEQEESYIELREDILSLRHGREWAGFDGIIESLLHKLNCKLIRVRTLSFSYSHRISECHALTEIPCSRKSSVHQIYLIKHPTSTSTTSRHPGSKSSSASS